MKRILLVVFLIISMDCFAQEADTTSYKAINGVIYKPNDEVKLGKGVGGDGNFMFIRMSDAIDYPLNKIYNNAVFTIKEVKIYKTGKTQKILLIFKEKHANYEIILDDAIEACEVIPCSPMQNSTGGVADELLKLKRLLDGGAITREEFDAQKKKLLAN